MKYAIKKKPISIIISNYQECKLSLKRKNIFKKHEESHMEFIPDYSKETITKVVYFGSKKPLITNSAITNKRYSNA